ncbi:MAG TPA: hypothetical protein VE993_09785 [Stellaceae bacterium]|nr:hypothetical protein [Stellaceae bacterium]
MNHSFILQALGIDTTRDDYQDALYQAGCSDALIAVIDGALFLDFEREAPLFEKAVETAKCAVESAGGTVVQVLPISE